MSRRRGPRPRPPGRVHPEGAVTCGLCTRADVLERADLRTWRRSRAHGTVHRSCFARMRARARAARKTAIARTVQTEPIARMTRGELPGRERLEAGGRRSDGLSRVRPSMFDAHLTECGDSWE
jgi:hypothetical protein